MRGFSILNPGLYKCMQIVRKLCSGLKITAGQRTMTSIKSLLTGHFFTLPEKVINRIFNRMSVGLEISLLFSIFHKVLPITIRRWKELNFVNNNILWVTNFCFIIYGRVVTTLNRYYLYIHLNFMMITSSESETRKSKQFVCLYRTREIHIYYSSV